MVVLLFHAKILTGIKICKCCCGRACSRNSSSSQNVHGNLILVEIIFLPLNLMFAGEFGSFTQRNLGNLVPSENTKHLVFNSIESITSEHLTDNLRMKHMEYTNSLGLCADGYGYGSLI